MPGYTDDQVTVYIHYTNWRGEKSWRHIVPWYISFKATAWHPEPQWILGASDIAKGELREFAMKNIHEWSSAPPTIDQPADSEGGEQ